MPDVIILYKVPENFAHLANAMPRLVWIAEPKGTVINYNDRIKELAGLSNCQTAAGVLQYSLLNSTLQKTERIDLN